MISDICAEHDVGRIATARAEGGVWVHYPQEYDLSRITSDASRP